MSDHASLQSPLLKVSGLEVAYGGIQAVKGIDLEICSGELVALIGANGAGKTSTLKALSGLLRPVAGHIKYDGEDTGLIPAHGFAQRGLVMVPEGRGVFSRFTVHENLLMGAYCRRDNDAIAADLELVYQLFPRLKERYKQLAGTLSGGEQQMVAIHVRCWRGHGCCCLMSLPWGLHRSLCRRFLKSSARLPARV